MSGNVEIASKSPAVSVVASPENWGRKTHRFTWRGLTTKRFVPMRSTALAISLCAPSPMARETITAATPTATPDRARNVRTR